jgi:hypothetical protein
MNRTVREAFSSGSGHLGYIYDFGSSTELVLSLSASLQVSVQHLVNVVARNEAPIWPCDVCGHPATRICAECANRGNGFLCGIHARSHGCGNDMLLPVVNSPRMGVCGYCG